MDLFYSEEVVPKKYTGACFLTKEKDQINHYLEGQLHRLDGHAVEYFNGWPAHQWNEYWIRGIEYPAEEYWNNFLVIEYKMNKILEL